MTISETSHMRNKGHFLRTQYIHVIRFSDLVDLWVIKVKCLWSFARVMRRNHLNSTWDHAARTCERFMYSVVKITRSCYYQTWSIHFFEKLEWFTQNCSQYIYVYIYIYLFIYPAVSRHRDSNQGRRARAGTLVMLGPSPTGPSHGILLPTVPTPPPDSTVCHPCTAVVSARLHLDVHPSAGAGHQIWRAGICNWVHFMGGKSLAAAGAPGQGKVLLWFYEPSPCLFLCANETFNWLQIPKWILFSTQTENIPIRSFHLNCHTFGFAWQSCGFSPIHLWHWKG